MSQTELDNGGMKVITTISLPMEEEMYKAVNENIAQIKETPTGATVSTLPPWALIGAELQDPKTGAILAEYPGRGQNMSAATVQDLRLQRQHRHGHPRAGRVVVQAVRAVDGRVAGHGRPEQHPELEHVPLRPA